MRMKRNKLISIILIISLIGIFVVPQPAQAFEEDSDNDWKYLCNWVDWDGEKLVNNSSEMYQMKTYEGLEVTPSNLQRENGITTMKIKVKNASKRDYKDLKISIGVTNGYYDTVYSCFVAEIGKLPSGSVWSSGKLQMNSDGYAYNEDTAIFAKSWYMEYISEDGERIYQMKIGDIPAGYREYQRRVDWVEQYSDDMWINCSPNIVCSKIMGGYKFSNMRIIYSGGQISILADVTNITDMNLPILTFDMHFENKKWEEIITYGGIVSPVESGQTVPFYASATLDHALYAYDWYASGWHSKNLDVDKEYLSDEIWDDNRISKTEEPLPTRTDFVKDNPWFTGEETKLSNNSPEMSKSFIIDDRWVALDEVRINLKNGNMSALLRVKNESKQWRRPVKPQIAFYDKQGNLLETVYGAWIPAMNPGDFISVYNSWYNRKILGAYSYKIVAWEEKVDSREDFSQYDLVPTPSPTLISTATPTVTPTPTVTATSTVTPTPTVTAVPTVTPTITSTVTPTVMPSNMPTEVPVVTSNTQKTVKGVKAKCMNNNKIKLSWKLLKGVDKYEIFRSAKVEGKYKSIGKTTGRIKTYIDASVRKGKRYFYKIIPVVNLKTGKEKTAKIVSAKTFSYNQPKLFVTKKKTYAGERYLEICFQKYGGKYAEIYTGKDKKYTKLNFKKRTIKKNRGRYRFRYISSGYMVYIKARTYTGKQKRSPWSKIYKIKL